VAIGEDREELAAQDQVVGKAGPAGVSVMGLSGEARPTLLAVGDNR
jgi:hypothetical protein